MPLAIVTDLLPGEAFLADIHGRIVHAMPGVRVSASKTGTVAKTGTRYMVSRPLAARKQAVAWRSGPRHYQSEACECHASRRLCRIESSARILKEGARMGGGESVVLLEEIEKSDDAIGTANRVRRRVSLPLPAGVHVLRPRASLGVVVNP